MKQYVCDATHYSINLYLLSTKYACVTPLFVDVNAGPYYGSEIYYATIFPCTTTISGFYWEVDVPPDPGGDEWVAFNIYKNGVLTDLAETISGDETYVECNSSVVFNSGDYAVVYWTMSTTEVGEIDDCKANITVVYNTTTDNSSVIQAQCHTNPALQPVQYYPITGFSHRLGSIFPSTEDDAVDIIPIAGTLKRFYVRVNSAPGWTSTAGETSTWTVRKNGADTGLSVSCTHDVSIPHVMSDTTDTVSVSPGDTLGIKLDKTDSGVDFTCWALEFVCSVDGTWLIMGGMDAEEVDSDDIYGMFDIPHHMPLASQAYGATEPAWRYSANAPPSPYGMQLYNWYFRARTAAGGGKERTFDVRVDDVSMCTATISGSSQTVTSVTAQVRVMSLQEMGLRTYRNPAANESTLSWSCAAFPFTVYSTSLTAESVQLYSAQLIRPDNLQLGECITIVDRSINRSTEPIPEEGIYVFVEDDAGMYRQVIDYMQGDWEDPQTMFQRKPAFNFKVRNDGGKYGGS